MKKRQTNMASTKKKKSNKDGIWSCVFAFIETIVLMVSFWGALWSKGQANSSIGVLELFVLIGSIFGIIFGIRGRKQEKRTHIIDEIGIAANVLLMIIIIILFIIGMSNI